MAGYTKNIAVIRTLKNGFSTDGGPLSGIIRAERYGTNLRIEASLINFAPLSEGKYVTAVSDGKKVCILDGNEFEGESEVDTSSGFAALVCFVNESVSPIASAVCGGFQAAALGIREEIEKTEFAKKKERKEKSPLVYEDEAVAEVNYYEYEQAFKDGGAVCEDPQKEEVGSDAREDDEDNNAHEEELTGGLAHGELFFEKMRGEIEKVLTSYPKEEKLERVVENSKWVKIDYGEGKFYVFGLIYSGEKPQYICYGVPSENPKTPPESLAGRASFIPSSEETPTRGYWVMYQDAATGASIKIEVE